jgi:osmotically inducible lipoprotein OsmB
MRIKSFLLLALAATSLSGCLQDPATRGVGGALAGALVADALDENIIAGAAIGGLGGAASCAIPGQLGCQPRY